MGTVGNLCIEDYIRVLEGMGQGSAVCGPPWTPTRSRVPNGPSMLDGVGISTKPELSKDGIVRQVSWRVRRRAFSGGGSDVLDHVYPVIWDEEAPNCSTGRVYVACEP